MSLSLDVPWRPMILITFSCETRINNSDQECIRLLPTVPNSEEAPRRVSVSFHLDETLNNTDDGVETQRRFVLSDLSMQNFSMSQAQLKKIKIAMDWTVFLQNSAFKLPFYKGCLWTLQVSV